MKNYVRLFAIILALPVFAMGQLTINALSPFPINQIMVIFVLPFWLILQRLSAGAAGAGLVLGFFMELFSAAPFGVVTLATLAGLFVFEIGVWRFFTNRSIFTVFISTGISLIAYYSFVASGYWLSAWFLNFVRPNLAPIALRMLISVLVTSCFIGVLYASANFFSNRFNPRYVKARGSFLW